MGDPLKKVDESKAKKPGSELKKVNSEAHAATYDESGDLRVKRETPIAAVEGGEVGSADTGVNAKIQEPVSGTTVNPIDTVARDSMNETSREARRPARVEKNDGSTDTAVDKKGIAADHKAKEGILNATGADKTEAADNAVKSQKENKAEESTDVKTKADERVGK